MLPTILFQRNELLTPCQKKVKWVFGRTLFTNLFVNFGSCKTRIEKKYFSICKKQFSEIENYFPKNAKNILSIGCGIGGVEYFFSNIGTVRKVDLIDRNFVSKKVIYGFDSKNLEAYNNLDYTKDFFLSKEPKKRIP